MQIRILGPVSLVVDGRAIPLGYAKQRCVLASLALEAGRVVTSDRIIERVWGDQAAESARAVLYGHLARLRRTLRDCDCHRDCDRNGSRNGNRNGDRDRDGNRNGDRDRDRGGNRDRGGDRERGYAPGPIQRVSGGYLLDVAPDTVDLYRFRALAARAREAIDGLSRVALWQEALGLWRGPALSCVDGAWVQAVRISLEQERLSARLNLCDAWADARLDEVALAELTDLAADHPTHEGIAARLMLALYRTGHPAGALEYFDALRHRLADRFGADPGPELAELQVQMLRREVPTRILAPSMA